MNRIVNISLIAIVIVLALLLQRSCNNENELKDYKNMYEAAQDTLHKTVDKLGRETTTTTLLYGQIGNFEKLVATKDSTLRKLQAIVNKNTITATIIGNNTHNTISSNTTSTTPRDTIRRHDTLFIYPEYISKWENKWEKFYLVCNKDTSIINYTVFNEFDLKQELKRPKWYKAKQAIVSVFNLNPHTKTTELQSFSVKPNKANKLKNFSIGAIVGAAAVFFLVKN